MTVSTKLSADEACSWQFETVVSMPRARNFLYVLRPLRYYHKSVHGLSDNHSYTQCSRFFTRDVVESMDELSAGRSRNEGEVASDSPSMEPSLDMSAKIRKMWS